MSYGRLQGAILQGQRCVRPGSADRSAQGTDGSRLFFCSIAQPSSVKTNAASSPSRLRRESLGDLLHVK